VVRTDRKTLDVVKPDKKMSRSGRGLGPARRVGPVWGVASGCGGSSAPGAWSGRSSAPGPFGVFHFDPPGGTQSAIATSAGFMFFGSLSGRMCPSAITPNWPACFPALLATSIHPTMYLAEASVHAISVMP